MAMEEVAEEFGAKAKTIVFLDHFKELPDPRQRGKVRVSGFPCKGRFR
jgi:hypothetical protein